MRKLMQCCVFGTIYGQTSHRHSGSG